MSDEVNEKWNPELLDKIIQPLEKKQKRLEILGSQPAEVLRGMKIGLEIVNGNEEYDLKKLPHHLRIGLRENIARIAEQRKIRLSRASIVEAINQLQILHTMGGLEAYVGYAERRLLPPISAPKADTKRTAPKTARTLTQGQRIVNRARQLQSLKS
jgi:hypothetical protein